MKIGVCLKQVPASDSRIKVSNPSAGVDLAEVKWEINPYDEFALEEALLLKDAGKATAVVVISLGGKNAEAKITEALARGADSAVRIDDPGLEGGDSLGKARALAAALKAEGVDLVLAGMRAIDDDNSQVPAMIAELLGWPQVLSVSKLEIDGGSVKAWRNAGGGAREIVATKLPAVVSMDKTANSPRYASLKGIMMAKKKTIAVKNLGALGVDAGSVGRASALVKEEAWGTPPQRSAVKMIPGEGRDAARELVRLLRQEAKVI